MPAHASGSNPASPARGGEVSALQPVGHKRRAGGAHHLARRGRDGAGEPVPAAVALGKETHAVSLLQTPEDLPRGAEAAVALLARNGIYEERDQLRRDRQPEDVLARDIIQLLVRKAHRHEKGIEVRHMVGDDDAGLGNIARLTLKCEARVQRTVDQSIQNVPDVLVKLYPIHVRSLLDSAILTCMGKKYKSFCAKKPGCTKTVHPGMDLYVRSGTAPGTHRRSGTAPCGESASAWSGCAGGAPSGCAR